MASGPLHASSRDGNSSWRSPFAAVATAVAVLTSVVCAAPAAADDAAVDTAAVVAPAAVAIAGTVAVGEQVSAEPGAWTPAETVLSYQWSVDVAPVDGVFEPLIGAVAQDYVIGSELVGLPLQVAVTGTAPDASTDTRTSSPVTVAMGQFTSAPVPTVLGSAKVGQELTADLTGWSHAPTFAPQWLANGVEILGATADRYAITPADLGKRLSVRVTATAGGFATTTRTSAETGVVALGVLTGSPVPVLSGTVRVGGAVTAVPGTWLPVGAALSYQWRRNGLPIAGATGTVYRPGVPDRGHLLSVSVTGQLPGYTKVTRTSAAATIAPGVFTTAPIPTISGTARVGYVLTARPGVWVPAAGTLAYRWYRNGALIPGVTGLNYRLTAADHGRQITFRVYAARTGWSNTNRTSVPTAVVAKPFAATYGPAIVGTARVGSALTAAVRAWSPAATFTYQWRRDGAAIAGAIGRTYLLTGSDYNRVITVTVTGRRVAYVTAAHTSGGTARVAGPAPTLSRDGTYQVGTQLPPGRYVTGATTFCYWERRSDAGDEFEGIIANDIGDGRRIVEVKASDAYFYTDGCGAWTRLIPLGAPGSTMGNGVFAVGTHVVPGTYQTSGSEDCYWARLSGFGAELEDITDNFFGDGQQIVRIEASDVGFESADCGTWHRVGN